MISVAMGIHGVEQLESQLLNQLSIPLSRLQNRVDQKGLSRLRVTQKVSLSYEVPSSTTGMRFSDQKDRVDTASMD